MFFEKILIIDKYFLHKTTQIIYKAIDDRAKPSKTLKHLMFQMGFKCSQAKVQITTVAKLAWHSSTAKSWMIQKIQESRLIDD